MDGKVTIDLSLPDAMTANSILSSELREDVSVKNNCLVRGEDVPNWLEREIEELLRIVQILKEAIVAQ